MRSLLSGTAGLALALFAAPAFAQADAPPAPASPFTVSGGATIVSDYRFRGISQTDKHFAIQGTLSVSHESGLYVGTWGSSIDDYVAFGSDQEIDLYGGYKKTFGGATVDGGLLYYYYPGSGGNNSDFFEPYLSITGTAGPVSLKGGAAYAWKQHAIAFANERDDNLYLYGEVSGTVPGTGVSLTGHFGHNFGRDVLTAGRKGYNDWSVTASYTWNHITFGASYVDTNFKRGQFVGPGGSQEAKGGFLGSIGVAF